MNQLLILCPLPLELEALLLRMNEQGYVPNEGLAGPLKVYHFPNLGWRFSLAGHGKTQFGIQTQYLINFYQEINGVICAGCAGGLAEFISIFDVVAAEKTIEHDYRLKFVKRPDPEFQGDEQLLKKIGAIKTNNFQIHLGPVASGDEDIVDLLRAKELRAQTGALAVAWEGAGGARASKFNEVPFLEIRGITDIADNSAPIDFASNLKIAMANVCDTLLAAFLNH